MKHGTTHGTVRLCTPGRPRALPHTTQVSTNSTPPLSAVQAAPHSLTTQKAQKRTGTHRAPTRATLAQLTAAATVDTNELTVSRPWSAPAPASQPTAH